MRKIRYILQFSFYLFVTSFLLTPVVCGQDDYQKWLREQQEEFQQYKSKEDQAFQKFLEKEWIQVELDAPQPVDKNPKPVTTPELSETPDDLPEIDIRLEPLPEKIKPKLPAPKAPKPDPEPQVRDIPKVDLYQINFFGSELEFPRMQIQNLRLQSKMDNKAIAKHWDKLTGIDYQKSLQSARYQTDALQLNDYGYCLLLNKMAAHYYPAQTNERKLLLWFLLLKSGYDAKIGYSDRAITLLVPSKQRIYGVKYLQMQGQKYYMFSFGNPARELRTIYTYEGSYPQAHNYLNFSIAQLPRLQKNFVQKQLNFNYLRQPYSFQTQINKNYIDYFAQFPQTQLDVYLQAPLDLSVHKKFVTALKETLAEKSEREAVNFLLALVQTGFQYKTDQEQFEKEKVMLPDETLFYPYSDCEDRSILFAGMVREVLGLPVVALDYPGHISTAVAFSKEVKGTAFIIDGKRYTACDPTYKNAKVGQVMPQFATQKPVVIALAANQKKQIESSSIFK